MDHYTLVWIKLQKKQETVCTFTGIPEKNDKKRFFHVPSKSETTTNPIVNL